MSVRIAYYPAFEDAAALTDRYWRAVHYFGPVAALIETLSFAGAVREIGPPPNYLDQTLPAREADIRARLTWRAAPELENADFVVVWDASRAADAALHAVRRVVVLDPRALHEGDLSIELGAEIAGAPAPDARARFLRAIAAEKQSRAHVFGTGPSMTGLNAAGLPDGVSIVCNSIVKDAQLMAQLRPRFLTAIDPIFHAGPSRHAEVFRAALVEALRAHRPWFVVQARDSHLYSALLPADVRDLILPLPVRYALWLNFAFDRRFWVTATRNVLTLTMLPLAAALAVDIRLYGCDGRAAGESESFWQYAPNTSFAPELALQQAAHPGFFTLDRDQYYALHCETLRRWIAAIERHGGQVRTGTPSHIPALAARRIEGVPALPSAPAALERAGRAAYVHRAAQSIYGAILSDAGTPAWLKRGLRAAVRGWRGRGKAIDNGQA